MKLIFCPVCKDIFKLVLNVRACSCGKSSGVMKDAICAQITGPGIPLGLNDKTLYEAIDGRPRRGPGKEFVAFVLPRSNKSILKIIPLLPQFNSVVTGRTSGVSPYEARPPRLPSQPDPGSHFAIDDRNEQSIPLSERPVVHIEDSDIAFMSEVDERLLKDFPLYQDEIDTEREK